MIDPCLTRTAFLTGTRFAPEKVGLAHHAVVQAGAAGGAAAVREQDAKSPGPGRQCFGGPAWPASRSGGSAAWVDTWARLVTTKGRFEASRGRMPHGYRTTRTPEERST
jgi:hypothetical protein